MLSILSGLTHSILTSLYEETEALTGRVSTLPKVAQEKGEAEIQTQAAGSRGRARVLLLGVDNNQPRTTPESAEGHPPSK